MIQTDFSILDQHIRHPSSAIVPPSRNAKLGPNACLLRQAAVLPRVVEQHYGKDVCAKLFQLNITPRKRGVLLFKQLEEIYRVYQVNTLTPHIKPTETQRLNTYLQRDLLGTTEIAINDKFVWKLEKRPREVIGKKGKKKTEVINEKVLTTFGDHLQYTQHRIYMRLRSSLKFFMAEQTHELLLVAIERREAEMVPPVTDERLLDQAVRTPWDWIKEWILDNICVLCTGAYHFTPLQTSLRSNAEPLSTWIGRVEDLNASIRGYKKGWDGIRKMLVLEEPKPVGKRLGCNHVVKSTNHNGKKC